MTDRDREQQLSKLANEMLTYLEKNRYWTRSCDICAVMFQASQLISWREALAAIEKENA